MSFDPITMALCKGGGNSGEGVTLPLLTLSVDTIMAAYTASDKTAVVNEREKTEILHAIDCGLPLVVRTETAEGAFETASTCVMNHDGVDSFYGELLGARVSITTGDGYTQIRFIPKQT